MPYNVVFITSDQQRRDACGCYGNPIVRTTHLDRLAERGIRFTQAYCDSPLCAPSRASYISGRQVHHHGALTHLINGKSPGIPGNGGIVCSETLGTMFRKAGYVTAAIGKLHVHGETRQDDLGFDVRAHRFYTYNYEDYINTVGKERVQAYLSDKDQDDEFKYNTRLAPVRLRKEYMQDSLTTATSIDFIRQNVDRPFFIHVGLEKPHPPWTTQARFLDLYDPAEIPLPPNRHEWWDQDPQFPFLKGRGFNAGRKAPYSDEKIKNCIAAYYACTSEMDSNVGKIVDTIEEEGLSGKTVIVFSTDHGDNLFEHGLEQKHCFYEGAVAVPLIISIPEGFPQGTESPQLTSLIDVMPTLAELAHIPVPADADGRSLVPAMRGKTDPDRAVFSEYYEWDQWPGRMIRFQEWKYIYYHGNAELLFNLKRDPKEMQNLAGVPEYADICAELRRRVLSDWRMALCKSSTCCVTRLC